MEYAGIRARLAHAQHVRQIKSRKTDVGDSLWLARICQFGLARTSFVPDRHFSELHQLCRYQRKLVADRARLRQRIHKTIDREGLLLGGLLTDIFGHYGRKIVDGLVEGRAAKDVLAELVFHVCSKLGRLALALEAGLDVHYIWRLHGLLQDCDAVQGRPAELDERVEDAF